MTHRILAAAVAAASLTASASAHVYTGNIYLTDDTFNKVYAINPDVYILNTILDGAFTPGIDSLQSIQFPEISGLQGPILFTNSSTDELIQADEVVDPGGWLLTPVGRATLGITAPCTGNGMAVGPLGHVYVANKDGTIYQIEQDYSSSTLWADPADGIVEPQGIAFFVDGSMFVANYGGGNILQIDENGGIGRGGGSSVWGTLPVGEEPVSITLSNDLEVFVRTFSGNIYRYRDGDPATRMLLGDYDTTDGLGTVAISFDNTALYTIRNGGQDLIEIDAETGASFVGFSLPNWAPTSLAVVGSQRVPGAMWEWGNATPGFGGFEPYCHGEGLAVLNEDITVDVDDFLGGVPAILMMGIKSTPSVVLGGQVYIDLASPTWNYPTIAPGVLPGEGDVSYPFSIPPVSSLVYTKFYFQAAALDPGAAGGVSMSNPMTMFIGL